MWVYAAVLVGVTVVAVGQLTRLRHHKHPGISPEALAAAAAERQVLADDALARLGQALRVSHESSYGWPCFSVHVESDAALEALELDTIRAAFTAAVEGSGKSGFDARLGVVFRVDGS